MAYSAPYLDNNGIHLPTYDERLEELVKGYKQIFGSDVYMGTDTMDYQLCALVAKCWDDLASLILDTYHARNPNTATGTSLDLILPLNGLIRYEATSSTVMLTLMGYANTKLKAGSQAIDVHNHIWEIQEEVTFNNNGYATALAVCTEKGAIAAGIGEINTIHTIDSNWTSVTNTVAATLGRNVESDAAVRLRRSLSVDMPSRSILGGIRAALEEVDDVESVNIIENYTDDDMRPQGLLPPHSIAAVVKGGADAKIADVIWKKKAPGVGTYGSTQYAYTDPYNQLNLIYFSRPTEMPVAIKIRLKTFATFDQSLLTTQIPLAVGEYISQFSIGDNLIVSMLNAVIFNANTAGYPIFSIASLSATGNGYTDETNLVETAYNVLLTNSGVGTVTNLGNNEWEIEVS